MIAFDPSEDEAAILDEVRKFAQAELRKLGRECEKARAIPDDLRRTYQGLGLATLEWPEALGGAGLSPVARVMIEEELAWGDAGLAIGLDGPGLASLAVLELAAEDQRARWLRRLAEPGHTAALAIAEADLGAELGHFTTTATLAPEGGYALSGRKLFVLQSPLADTFVVLAKLAGGAGGNGAFVVEKGAKGLTLGREDDRIGLQAVRSGEVLLDDVRVGLDARLEPTGEWAAAYDRFLARIWILTAARAVGVARASLEYATFYAQDRSAFGRKIGSFQGIAFKIADMAMETDGARWLVWRAAANLAKGRDIAREAAQAALYANDTCVRAAIECVQVLGGAGFMEDYPAEKWMREARALAMIGGGDAVRAHLAAEREYGKEHEAAADPQAAFAAFGQAFGT